MQLLLFRNFWTKFVARTRGLGPVACWLADWNARGWLRFDSPVKHPVVLQSANQRLPRRM